MRIALVASSLRLAGAEKQFVYIARALTEAGAEVQVFYLGPGGYYQAILRRMGIPLSQIFARGRPWRMLLRLIKALRRFRPEVVLASQFGDLIFAAPAGRLNNALVLGGVRSDGFYELGTCGRRFSFMLRLSDGLIANSHQAKDNLISKGVAPLKIAVLSNVLDLDEFDSQSTLTPPQCVPPERVIAAAVGSLHPCKRFDRFLDALSLARKSYPAGYGVVAGKDLGVKAALEQRASSLGLLPDHVKFLGECDRIPALLRNSRLLVLCSDYEGFPNVILEAMAARLPIITAPVGDAPRIVEHSVSGFVIEKHDTKAVASKMVTLMANSELRISFGEKGRQRVEQEHSFPGLAPRLLSILSHFAHQRSKTATLKALEQMPSRAFPTVPVGQRSIMPEVGHHARMGLS
jgi:glycosyltransferase involved in cell wall biosynthesis